MIEHYLPKAMDEERLRRSSKPPSPKWDPTMKDMGAVMKNVMAKLQATGARAEGRTVSDIVKKQLGG